MTTQKSMKKRLYMACYAIDQDINYVDTAYPYHEGMSEFVIGKALQEGYREKVYLATKLPSWLITSIEDMVRYFNEQLEGLRTNYIDLLMCETGIPENFKNFNNAEEL